MRLSSFVKGTLSASVVEKGTYFPFIDGLRGLAVLLVVFGHTIQHLQLHSSLALVLAEFGGRGVQLFFILSAFTLFSSSLVRFRNDTHPTRNFYIRRAFRILPFWWIMVAFWALYYHSRAYQILPSVVFLFGFLRFYGDLEIVPGGWTLFVEETFYLLLPVLFSKISNLWRALGLFAALWLLGDVWKAVGPSVPLFNQQGFVFFAPLSQWFAFGLGIVGYYLIRNELFKKLLLENPSAWLLLDTLALGGVWFFLGADFRIQTIALFVIFLAAFAEGGLIGRMMKSRVLMRMGRYCYSMYLLQFPVLLLMDPAEGRIFSALHMTASPHLAKLLIYYPLVLTILLALSFVTFNLIEKPCIDLGKKIIFRLTERSKRQAMASEETPVHGIDEAAQF